MHKLLISMLFMFGATAASAAEYEEIRHLSLEARDIESLSIDAGAGNLVVIGDPEATTISATATIQVPRSREEKAQRRMEKNMQLTLDQYGGRATLVAYFEREWFSFGKGPTIHLEVVMPADLDLSVDDGTGSLSVENVRGNLHINDGTGSMVLTNVGGNVEIDDGTGSIKVNGVGGDLWIDDGTGSINVRHVGGSVTIDDGTGAIDVSDVEEDLIVVDDGTGGVDYANVKGHVRVGS